MTTAHLIYGLPSENPDLYYAIGANVADPLIFLGIGKIRYVVAYDTETDVLKRQAKGCRILSYGDYFRKAKSQTDNPTSSDACVALLKEKGVRRVTIHPYTQVRFVEGLRARGIRVDVGDFPLYPTRLVKTPTEIKAITQSQVATFQAIRHVESILSKSRISGKHLIHNGKKLTSEMLHTEAKVFLLKEGYTNPADLIIACGDDSTEPHNHGSGPIRPHQSIIVDIFPKSEKTTMYGDATRTFCKGKPSDELQRMYLAVREAQEMAIRMVRPGVNGSTIHAAIHQFFKALGFFTGERGGRLVGFFHGTGHGLGLALHEEPTRINASNYILKPGNVVTVEPGLYYPGVGAVRIEDVVVVTKTGCKVLGKYPKKLKIV